MPGDSTVPAQEPRWTPEQRDAITSTGANLLVSAAAGSGKTSVLSERVAFLIAEQRAHVTQLLVVTFTEAAATEMRHRIEMSLRQRLDANPEDAHLIRQLALMDQAQISTLHAFCGRLLHTHFHRLGIDPAFRTLDGDEAAMLQREVARELIEDRYTAADAAAFRGLLDAYVDGYDDALAGLIVEVHDMLRSVVNPDAWRRQSLGRIRQALRGPIEDSDLGRQYQVILRQQLSALERSVELVLAEARRHPGLRDYVGYCQWMRATVLQWQPALDQPRWMTVLGDMIRGTDWPRLPSIPNHTPGKDTVKARIDAIRDKVKEGTLGTWMRFTSEEWADGLRSLRPHAHMFLRLVREFGRRYQRRKSADRVLDFSDLEHFALRLLCDGPVRADTGPSDVARLLHKQFQHVLVDEYQDINQVQDTLLRLAGHESAAGTSSPNLFCVGDVKQSIYGFRLAEPQRFLQRQRIYRARGQQGRVIDLQKNFRSRAPLLAALNTIFGRLMTADAADIDYDQTQRLHAGADYGEAPAAGTFTGAPLELHLVPDRVPVAHEPADAEDDDRQLERDDLEAALVAERIADMMGQRRGPRMQVRDKDTYRPIVYRDIVILLRAARFHADRFVDVLRRRGVPVFNTGGGGYFDAREVRDMLSLLSLLDNQRQDVPMAAVLRSPLSGLPEPDNCLAQIHAAYAGETPAVPFHVAVTRYASEKDDALAARLRDFLADLAQWRQAARERRVPDLLWDIYERTGYLTFCEGLENGAQRVANLLELHRRSRQFSQFSRQGLYRFIRFLRTLRQETDAAQPSELGEGEDVVRIMTVHKSKGLEFPVVFVPQLGKRINFGGMDGPILADRHAGLAPLAVDLRKQIRYPSLASVVVGARLRHQAIAEELRVLYVALTRAKEHLVLVGTASPDKVERWRADWSAQGGTLPAAEVLSASSMLDWIGPVAAMTEGTAEAPFAVREHSVEEARDWRMPKPTKAEAGKLAAFASLQPLGQGVAVGPDAQSIIDRLTWAYPFAPQSRLAASQSVTSLTKGNAAPARRAPASADSATAPSLPRPAFLFGARELTGAERGEATHLFLQHLDFSQGCDGASLRAQLERLRGSQFMSESQADAVAIETVEWFIGTDLGRLVCQQAKDLLRELPVNFALSAEEFIEQAQDDPRDCVMLRGRIDLLVPVADKWVVVDYKTDHVAGDALKQRIAAYTPQLGAYRLAVQRITGRVVTHCHLVFLSVRHIATF